VKTHGLCLAILLWPAVNGWTSTQPTQQDRDALAHRLFVEIESTARLPVARQAERLPRIYRDVCPPFARMWVAHTVFGPAPAAAKGESPKQLADRIAASGGWPVLAEGGRARCKALLSAHRNAVEALAREDLRSGPRRDHHWAFHVIGELRLVRLFDDVIAALRDPDPTYAAQALRDLGDPRAIPFLIKRFPEEPTRFFEVLRTLQNDRPAHPLLLELLRAGDAEVRWRAAYTLVESRDPVLVSIIPSLVSDPATDVRRQAGYMVVNFDGAIYRRARPSIEPLLTDPEMAVRADVAVAMASRKDVTSAPVLLALARQEENMESWRQSNVVQAIHTLTGTYFGLVPGTPSPSPAVRDKALTDFALWIQTHPPADR
jgi:hypothetical protein